MAEQKRISPFHSPAKRPAVASVPASPANKRVREVQPRITELTAEQIKNAYYQLTGMPTAAGRTVASKLNVAVPLSYESWSDTCVTCNYSVDGAGYPNMKVTPSGKKGFMIGVRHITIAHFQPDAFKSGRPEDDVSHFHCHNKLCINPRHLVVEDHDVNVSRLCCKLFGTKPGYRCPHQPTCGGATPVQ